MSCPLLLRHLRIPDQAGPSPAADRLAGGRPAPTVGSGEPVEPRDLRPRPFDQSLPGGDGT